MSKLLKTLVIDSATPYLYISLYEGNDELDAYYQEGHNDHSVKLMSELERMLTRNNCSMKDINKVVIGIGPGSYTGLRVGVVVAKMFGWTLGISLGGYVSGSLLVYLNGQLQTQGTSEDWDETTPGSGTFDFNI